MLKFIKRSFSNGDDGHPSAYPGWQRRPTIVEGLDGIGAAQPSRRNSFVEDISGNITDPQLMMEKFKASMKQGRRLLKHGRQGDPHYRIILIDTDEEHITWRKENGNPTRKNPNIKMKLSDIKEIRWGAEPDTDKLFVGEGLAGTQILRDSCGWEFAPMAFSIIWPKRSLNLQCTSREECGYMIRCLRILVNPEKAAMQPPAVEVTTSSTSSGTASSDTTRLNDDEHRAGCEVS